jgi:hypothetical protein
MALPILRKMSRSSGASQTISQSFRGGSCREPHHPLSSLSLATARGEVASDESRRSHVVARQPLLNMQSFGWLYESARSLPWYMFLVPTLVTLFLSLFDSPGPHSIWSDTRPEYGYWALMWIVAKLGFFVWVLRQLLRYGVFRYKQRITRALEQYSLAFWRF